MADNNNNNGGLSFFDAIIAGLPVAAGGALTYSNFRKLNKPIIPATPTIETSPAFGAIQKVADEYLTRNYNVPFNKEFPVHPETGKIFTNLSAPQLKDALSRIAWNADPKGTVFQTLMKRVGSAPTGPDLLRELNTIASNPISLQMNRMPTGG